MSTNPLFGNKKRESSVFYGAGHAQVNISTAAMRGPPATGNERHRYPPPKRSRTAHATEMKPFDDPFNDHEDFTADDLEEIDILASQAYTQDPDPAEPAANHTHSKAPPSNGLPYSFKTGQQHGQQRLKNSVRREPLESCGSKESFGLEVLQAQHEDLRQKLKELQDQLLVKNGEIKVLRDTLRQTETDMEQQKVSHMMQEKEKDQIQNEKEKELSKKLQSLQSELQFKEAEMNELRNKLQTCERNNKPVVATISPKKSPSTFIKPESLYPGKGFFPTKESFNAEMTVKASSSVAPLSTRIPVIEAANENATVLKANKFPSSFYSQKNNGQGSVLLNALMQQPIYQGSLGLCHLLSNNPDLTVGSPTRTNCTSKSTSTSVPITMMPTRCSALREAQQLAFTGLNSIAMNEGAIGTKDSQNHCGLLHLNKMSRLPGAVHLLPLVEFHISSYYQALQTFEKSVVGPSENQSIASSSTERGGASSIEDPFVSVVDAALASLGILYHMVFYSLEVVNTLLRSCSETRTPAATTSELTSRTLKPIEGANDDQNYHPVFKKLLQILCSPPATCQRDLVCTQTLKVLVKLAENSPNERLSSFHSLFARPALQQCLSPDSPIPVAHMTVRLLAVLTDHQKLTDLLCTRSESCTLLSLFRYVISRPDKTTSGSLWLQLEHEVVRFLSKLSVQDSNWPAAPPGIACSCNREGVKALVLALHQEWLCVRRSAQLPLTSTHDKAIQFLRDTVLLLHSLSQKDKNFSEHCLEVLHQYDQAMPGVRAVFKKFHVLKENEEFALDELCPPEAETEDEYMDCT
ncbi:ATR-interacting protein [Bombina bombina]|uniref:ATR-interacting protein n=1 Tax=Bombina bombina TaxID=8345 RepID=UPI00235AB99E|nr:ATR-interacting protein [Bombina bombina]XP_053577169.1 ATR-interacting protein [Bombina bombina]